ncbi:hypothetical protein, partial [Streptomyces europaeiscabiei]|uniref:hypothetical protein n=1 Tax=Streptomyces europaeiscabiei TaxID=146819 RepID=UPI0038F6D0CB
VELDKWNKVTGSGSLTIVPWKKDLPEAMALRKVALGWTEVKGKRIIGGYLPNRIADGSYNPFEDVILCPFNVSFGVIELNRHIATYL